MWKNNSTRPETLSAWLHRLEPALALHTLPDVQALTAAVATLRQHPITVQPHWLPPQTSGVWLHYPGEIGDVISLAEDASTALLEHSLITELCHMLLGHPPIVVTAPPRSLAELQVLCLKALHPQHDAEANAAASLLEAQWHRIRPRHVPCRLPLAVRAQAYFLF